MTEAPKARSLWKPPYFDGRREAARAVERGERQQADKTN